MKRYLALSITLSLLLATVTGCVAPGSDSAAPVEMVAPAAEAPVAAINTADEPNFLLLISDAPNDIGDFAELWISIAGVGLVNGDEEGIVEEMFTDDPLPQVNLVELTGEAAVALWSGYVEEGDYTKIFIYVEDVWGVLTEGGEEIEIKLPSNKLQLDLPVVVGTDETTEFVFDITVHRAGNSGQYILKPQTSESGQGAAYRLMEQSHERVRVTRPEDWAGTPEWADSEDNEDVEPPARGAQPDWTPTEPEQEQGENEPGRPEGAGRPEDAGKPA